MGKVGLEMSIVEGGWGRGNKKENYSLGPHFKAGGSDPAKLDHGRSHHHETVVLKKRSKSSANRL